MARVPLTLGEKPMRPMLRAAAAGSLLLALVILSGCGGQNMAEVKGAVKLDGQPIDGAIQFDPVDGKAKTTGGPIKAGQFSVKVPVGTMKVSITSPKIVGKKKLY